MATFNEQFKSKHVAPTFGNDGATDFPMEEVIQRLDGTSRAKPEDSIPSDVKLDAAQLTRMLLEWLVNIKAKDNRGLSPIATRTLACVWVVNPKLIGNCAGRMVAKAYGISYQKFSEHAADFSREFGIRNQFQDHDWRN